MNCNELFSMNCTQFSFEIIKIFVTLIIGGAAAWIAKSQSDTANQQRRIAEAKLNLDLFERRLKIFDKTWTVASSVWFNSDIIHPPSDYTNLYPEAYFLFGSEVEDYMKEIARKMTELAVARAYVPLDADSAHSEKKRDKQVDLEIWMEHAAKEGIRKKFAPYLDFSKWHPSLN